MNNQIFEKKNIALCILFSILTCGIYALYWFYTILSTIYDMANMENTAGTDLLFTIITCGIYSFFIFYKLGEILAVLKENAGFRYENNYLLFMILNFFGLAIVNYCIIQDDLNKIIDSKGNYTA